MNEFELRSKPAAVTAVGADAATLFLAKVFNWMTAGLTLTAITAFLVASSPAALNFIFGNKLVFFGLIFGELGLIIALSARVERLSSGAATAIYLAYALLNGVTLSMIFIAFTATSIATTFFVTAGMFGGMAIYGYVTKRDLTSLGSFVFMGLIGIVLASIVNIFLASSMLSFVISGIGVLVFTGLTAYDVQKITRTGAVGIMDSGEAVIRKAAIMGALQLYLDFVNLFIHLLYFLGGRRD